MGMSVDGLSASEAAEAAMERIRRSQRCRVVTPNAEFGLRARQDADFLEIINSSQIILADGIGVVLASRILGCPLPQKAAGIVFGRHLCELMAREQKRLFLLGAAPGVAERAGQRLAETYPGLFIAGTHDGFFKEDEQVARLIAESGADALFVGMGSPRQEQFIAQYEDMLGASVLAGVGGSLDVYAGDLKDTPRIFVSLGLEWFYRLIRQPSRIKRMIKLPLYLVYAVGHRLRHGERS